MKINQLDSGEPFVFKSALLNNSFVNAYHIRSTPCSSLIAYSGGRTTVSTSVDVELDSNRDKINVGLNLEVESQNSSSGDTNFYEKPSGKRGRKTPKMELPSGKFTSKTLVEKTGESLACINARLTKLVAENKVKVVGEIGGGRGRPIKEYMAVKDENED